MPIWSAIVRSLSVMLFDGLRYHACPKVASTAIAVSFRTIAEWRTPEDPGDEYRFMIVRHPLDRLVSAWSFFCDPLRTTMENNPEFQRIGYWKGMGFDDFLEIALKRHGDNIHTRKQINYAGPHEIDLLVPLENLPEAWEMLSQKFDYLKPLVHNHTSNRKRDWKDYYDYDTRKAAESIFEEDIELYRKAIETRL